MYLIYFEKNKNSNQFDMLDTTFNDQQEALSFAQKNLSNFRYKILTEEEAIALSQNQPEPQAQTQRPMTVADYERLQKMNAQVTKNQPESTEDKYSRMARVRAGMGKAKATFDKAIAPTSERERQGRAQFKKEVRNVAENAYQKHGQVRSFTFNPQGGYKSTRTISNRSQSRHTINVNRPKSPYIWVAGRGWVNPNQTKKNKRR
jgi:hypothetical protein